MKTSVKLSMWDAMARSGAQSHLGTPLWAHRDVWMTVNLLHLLTSTSSDPLSHRNGDKQLRYCARFSGSKVMHWYLQTRSCLKVRHRPFSAGRCLRRSCNQTLQVDFLAKKD
jgi:hypothetical protein